MKHVRRFLIGFLVIIVIAAVFGGGNDSKSSDKESHEISSEQGTEEEKSKEKEVVEATRPEDDSASLDQEASSSEEKVEQEQAQSESEPAIEAQEQIPAASSFDLSTVPAYSGSPCAVINNNVPFFSESDLVTTPFETYSNLDSLGRCGVAYANICKEIMPTAPRGEIGMIKPSGWHTVKYNGVVDGNYLYNRCHLIGYQLAGENANTKNLITGTRYMNTQGMLPYENDTASYVERTGHHVLYRVTPVFEGNNLVASGVLMEAHSVEDNNFYFCVYCYNVQPGIAINYANGDSSLDGTISASTDTPPASVQEPAATPAEPIAPGEPSSDEQAQDYILNTSRKKIHLPNCRSVGQMAEKNKKAVHDTISNLEAQGYTRCGNCLK